jgi:hypothetical protein
MATNLGTATVAAAKGESFPLSDGRILDVNYNGTNWGYQVSSDGGATFGARTALTNSPASTRAVWTLAVDPATGLSTDVVYGAVSGSGVSLYVYRLSVAAGVVTQTNTLTGDNVPVLGIYHDATNNRVHVVEQLTSAFVAIYVFNAATLANVITTPGYVQLTAGSPPNSGQTDVTWAVAGSGGGTYYVAWFPTAGSTVFNVVQVVGTGATGAPATVITSQTAETSEPVLAANCTGLDATWDGTNIVFAANQNNAALRTTRRTAANTYDAWSTLVTESISGKPALARRVASGNAVVFYRSNLGQANGQIRYFKRTSGTWDSGSSLLAGGASTGWAEPRARTDAGLGPIRVHYITGTANPWTHVADVLTFAPPVPTNTSVPTISGSAIVGQTLNASTGAWTSSPTGYAYRWLRDGVAISGATAAAYTLQSADVGHAITVGVIASNAGGASAEAVSASVVPAAAGGPWPLVWKDGLVPYAGVLPGVAPVEGAYYEAPTGVAIVRSFDDPIALADSVGRTSAAARALADPVALADSILGGVSALRALADAVALADQLDRLAAYQRLVVDSITVADAQTPDLVVSGALLRTFNDAVALDDTLSRVVGYQRPLTEAVDLADALDRVGGFGRLLADPVGLADALTTAVAAQRAFVEAVGVGDQLDRVATYQRDLLDALALSDGISTGASSALSRSFDDSIAISDALVTSSSFIRVQADVIGLLDGDLAPQFGMARLLTDSLVVVAALDRTADYQRALLESVAVADSLRRSSTYLRAVDDTLLVVDVFDSIFSVGGPVRMLRVRLAARPVAGVRIKATRE